MNQPCQTAVTCPCDNLPATGYSTESPDVSEFMATAFVAVVPALGNSSWTRLSCQDTELSPTSVAAALLAAQLEAGLCAAGQASPYAPDTFPPNESGPPNTNPSGGGGGSVPGGGGSPSGGTFFNAAQTAQFVCPDGSTFQYTVQAGIFTGSTQLIADTAAQSYAQSQVNVRAICLSPLSNTICNLNQPFSATITGTGGELATAPNTNTWTLSGSLPDGLTFQPNTPNSGMATITGTPTTQNQIDNFAVTLTDPQGNTNTRNYSLSVACPTSYTIQFNGVSGEVGYAMTPYVPGGGYDAGLQISNIPGGSSDVLGILFASFASKTWNMVASGTGMIYDPGVYNVVVNVNGTNNYVYCLPDGSWSLAFSITTSGCVLPQNNQGGSSGPGGAPTNSYGGNPNVSWLAGFAGLINSTNYLSLKWQTPA